MRIGFISQWYPPEHGSAALPGTIARALADHGHEIDVVTGYPNYPQGVLQDGWRQRLTHTEVVGAVTVHRTPMYISHDDRAVRRMCNYISFAVSATATALLRLRRVEAVWVHATPILPALPAIVLSKTRGIPFVLHIQDLWPDTVLASGMLPRRLEPLVRAPLDWFCRWAYSRAAVIGVIAPGMRHELVSRGVPDDKIVDIPNWADESTFRRDAGDPSIRKELGLPPGFVAMYAGAMGEVQGLETVIQAAQRLEDRPDIHVALVGSGAALPRLQQMASDRGLDNVTFVPAQPFSRMSSVLGAADVQIVCLRDLPLYRITLPSKVQATLAAGRPVIVSAGGDAGRVVEQAGAGIACPPGEPDALAAALRSAADRSDEDRARWGDSGRRYYEEHLSERVGVMKILNALRTAQATRRRSR